METDQFNESHQSNPANYSADLNIGLCQVIICTVCSLYYGSAP